MNDWNVNPSEMKLSLALVAGSFTDKQRVTGAVTDTCEVELGLIEQHPISVTSDICARIPVTAPTIDDANIVRSPKNNSSTRVNPLVPRKKLRVFISNLLFVIRKAQQKPLRCTTSRGAEPLRMQSNLIDVLLPLPTEQPVVIMIQEVPIPAEASKDEI